MKKLFTLVLLLGFAVAQHGGHSSMGPDLKTLSGKAFDRAFLSMMIPHHQGAVEMSRWVLPRAKNAQVKNWANAIVAAQQREITQMTEWLKPLGGSEKAAADMMKADMAGMVTALRGSADPDRGFVQGMIPHHASAIEMALLAIQRSSDPRIIKLARGVLVSQSEEIYQFRNWLK
jgi:uncharacterized protein (DUF305 family)